MYNSSSIKTVKEIISSGEVIIHDVSSGGIDKNVTMENDREYVVPEYQREITWSSENVQVLIDDLMNSSKFLGTITLSKSMPGKYEVIDGQQRLTVITLIISFLNEYVNESKKIKELCNICNKSFPDFKDALSYKFEYQRIMEENRPLFERIEGNDKLNQKDDFARIWGSIVERISPLSETDKEKLLLSLSESEMNVIVHVTDNTDSQRKFCVDYFIDINNKSVVLDSIDIIRAYAFREDFSAMTDKWGSIQDKLHSLYGKVKYKREDLYYQYFICNVNKEIEYKITKLSDDYKIKENVKVRGKKFDSGTYVWEMFKNDKFYSGLLNDLNDYLDFITAVISTETGGDDRFKKYFYIEQGILADETRILNAHTIINAILRNDDIVPKMMVMKYFIEVLKPQVASRGQYGIISHINIIATIFTLSTKRKGSDVIAGKLLAERWQDGIREYAKRIYQDVPGDMFFDKAIKEDGRTTKESGLHAARRYFSMIDACTFTSGNISINEDIFKNENISTGDKDVEHFLVNREFKAALYRDGDGDGDGIEIEIIVPRKTRKYMATIANYLIMDSNVNKSLKNMPVYEKIESLEKLIPAKGIGSIIPSEESQKHYYIIKKFMHDESKYPKQKLEQAKKKTEKMKLLKSYFQDDFDNEYEDLIEGLKSPQIINACALDYELGKRKYKKDKDDYIIEFDSSLFGDVRASIDYRSGEVTLEVTVCDLTRPDSAIEEYINHVRHISDMLKNQFDAEPEWTSCDNGMSRCPSKIVALQYTFDADIENINAFVKVLEKVESDIEILENNIDTK